MSIAASACWLVFFEYAAHFSSLVHAHAFSGDLVSTVVWFDAIKHAVNAGRMPRELGIASVVPEESAGTSSFLTQGVLSAVKWLDRRVFVYFAERFSPSICSEACNIHSLCDQRERAPMRGGRAGAACVCTGFILLVEFVGLVARLQLPCPASETIFAGAAFALRLRYSRHSPHRRDGAPAAESAAANVPALFARSVRGQFSCASPNGRSRVIDRYKSSKMNVMSVFASLRELLRRLYRALLNVVISFLTGMSELERLLSRFPGVSTRRASPALQTDTSAREVCLTDGAVCRLAVARNLVKIENHLRTRSPSTGIKAGLDSALVPVEDLSQLICAECGVRSAPHGAQLVTVLRMIRRKQEAADRVKARARQRFDPGCSENHRRLERLWCLFFDKPLPPSFHHCSSFPTKGGRADRQPSCANPSPSSTLSSSPTPTGWSASSSSLRPEEDSASSSSEPLSAACAEPGASSAGRKELCRVPRDPQAAADDAGRRSGARGGHQAPEAAESSPLCADGRGGSLERQESSWGELGFQHPLHDFRGAGCLGADCLLVLGRRFPEVARRLLEESREEQFWMPFAATSINVVGWLLDIMNRHLLDVFFFACDETSCIADGEVSAACSSTKSSASNDRRREDFEGHADEESSGAVPEVFLLLYVAAFTRFCRFWRRRRPENVLQFGAVSMDFRARLENAFREFASSPEDDDLGAMGNVFRKRNPPDETEIYGAAKDVLEDIVACIESEELDCDGDCVKYFLSGRTRQGEKSARGAEAPRRRLQLSRLVNHYIDK
ncbi:hypothetical protein BESB_084200 [Besnoitia besnoiti]|uniref:ELMO domain-containing protein n=1 Tax=Besnoitia besnoiti TaxID=94643 RepID=A0A2A9MA76_BESBE|nr:hypothetical protein BESB_084200 [Besnoitia besnoiti]PFH33221.1 hypothetical protein BESB_084200 [Besnoitia besnoiti]